MQLYIYVCEQLKVVSLAGNTERRRGSIAYPTKSLATLMLNANKTPYYSPIGRKRFKEIKERYLKNQGDFFQKRFQHFQMINRFKVFPMAF